MKYNFIKSYFISNDDDIVLLSGKNNIAINFNSNLSQKVLSKLHSMNKPYLELEGEEKVIEPAKPKMKFKPKKKKVKINESQKPEAEPKDKTYTERES